MPITKQVEIACKVVHITDSALKIYVEAPGGGKRVWVPRSLISDEVAENGTTTAVFVPEWFAEQEGLV